MGEYRYALRSKTITATETELGTPATINLVSYYDKPSSYDRYYGDKRKRALKEGREARMENLWEGRPSPEYVFIGDAFKEGSMIFTNWTDKVTSPHVFVSDAYFSLLIPAGTLRRVGRKWAFDRTYRIDSEAQKSWDIREKLEGLINGKLWVQEVESPKTRGANAKFAVVVDNFPDLFRVKLALQG